MCLCVCIESSICQLPVQGSTVALVMLKIQFKHGVFCKTATLPSYRNFVDATFLLWLSAICLCVSSGCMNLYHVTVLLIMCSLVAVVFGCLYAVHTHILITQLDLQIAKTMLYVRQGTKCLVEFHILASLPFPSLYFHSSPLFRCVDPLIFLILITSTLPSLLRFLP